MLLYFIEAENQQILHIVHLLPYNNKMKKLCRNLSSREIYR
jgi:hypothetical protein